MRKLYALAVLLLMSTPGWSQLVDKFWFSGFDEYPGTNGPWHAVVRLIPGDVLPRADSIQLAFNFESTMALAAASFDRLFFYSNGCEVANRNHQVMPNGSGLNPGPLSQQICNWKGYILPQGAMALPAPSDSTRFILLHMAATYNPVKGLVRSPLYYSEIDMTLDNGLGDVLTKNNLLLEGDLGTFTVVRHGNGRDWWVLVPEFGNKIWHTFLLSPEGFTHLSPQTVSMQEMGCVHQEATTASLNGNLVASWGDCKISVWNFERCSGDLSARLNLDVPEHLVPGGGLAFSPSGQYLYVTSQTVLYRADLLAASPRLDTMRFSYDPYYQSAFDVPGNTFHYMITASNGAIYINSPFRARHLHILDKSDTTKRKDLILIPQGLSLPVASVRTLPYFPNFKLFDWSGSVCDTLGINGPSVAIESPVPDSFRVRLSPNPATDRLLVEWFFPDGVAAGEIPVAEIFDARGGLVTLSTSPEMDGRITLETSALPEGLYFLRLQFRRYQWCGKFVKN